MRNTIPKEYPTELNNEDLLNLIKEYSKEATDAGRSTGYSVGPSYYKEMVDIGQSEINNRIQKNLFTQIEKLTTEIGLLKEDNKASSKTNLRLSIITIVLAILTVCLSFLTITDSNTSQNSETVWRKSLIELFNKNNSELQNIKLEITNSRIKTQK
ncbi:MAG: hypothetical protein ACRYFB_06780 [Janthinobacterium lividum]